jgi:hypothetical protein
MANIKAINVDDEVVYLKAVGEGTEDNPHVSVTRVESTVLASGAATEVGQQRIPGFDIPKHNRVVITEDAAGKLTQVIYYLDNLQVCALEFEYSGYAFIEPYKTTTITRS